jgi:hypothetical protein
MSVVCGNNGRAICKLVLLGEWNMVDKRKAVDGFSPTEMVNRRVDEELAGYGRAFEALQQLKDDEKQEEAESRHEAERYAAA